MVDECGHLSETRVVNVHEHYYENVFTCADCENERIVNDRRMGGSRAVKDDILV